jgi:hypothetical protein
MCTRVGNQQSCGAVIARLRLLITNLVLILFLNNIVLDKPLVSLRILLLSGGMNCLAFIYNWIHGIG